MVYGCGHNKEEEKYEGDLCDYCEEKQKAAEERAKQLAVIDFKRTLEEGWE